MPSSTDSRERRLWLERAWAAYLQGQRTRGAARTGVRAEIAASWKRSADHLAPSVDAAPLADPDETAAVWEESPLRDAVRRLEPELRRAAGDGDLVVAVTDPHARILWTYADRIMRRRAERVNFVPGGRWDESSVGTNALDLALRTGRAATVYSAEHYAGAVHGWACWAAPVHHPGTGAQLGVLDLSTTWERAHPMGLATARALAGVLEREIPAAATHLTGTDREQEGTPEGLLRLRLLGRAEAWLGGNLLRLTHRQTEILAVLALNNRGLSLDMLHARVYGHGRTSRTTLKAEVSHLRSILGGRIGSRPYRLQLPVRCDANELLEHLRAGDVAAATEVYGGDLLPGTDAPALVEHGHYLAVALREALLDRPEPQAVLRYADHAPHDVEVLERAVAALGGAPHPARPLLTACLRTANR
ncbi:hypothetical protein SAMN04489713_11092 [Actinomadura madurae]|uniref:OmpR/PhoB-type domain-containing protein n=1 Tax=Actinomadura madurae TaxID=1993 RepID=A0A1I5KRH9_9ACTN|nr:hypothetical protein SAMN04489713_11092 [Actinomadura madurae]SPT49906.1 DNA-binding transcriptional regulator DhaR [Actinomadura madurae]